MHQIESDGPLAETSLSASHLLSTLTLQDLKFHRGLDLRRFCDLCKSCFQDNADYAINSMLTPTLGVIANDLSTVEASGAIPTFSEFCMDYRNSLLKVLSNVSQQQLHYYLCFLDFMVIHFLLHSHRNCVCSVNEFTQFLVVMFSLAVFAPLFHV
jgi:hypothetical protein